MQPHLSIVLPTCNRASLLAAAIDGIASGTACAHEIIVVDGASEDATQDVCADAGRKYGARIRVIREQKREGFVRATNKGFQAATGRYMTWLNDDARPHAGALDGAVEQLAAAERHGVGFVAMFHRWHSTKNIAYQTTLDGRTYSLCHVRGTLYANFPVGLRSTFERLNYFDERYWVCAADPDLSLKAWNAGLRVEPACGSLIDHDEVLDARRAADTPRGADDNARLFAKWMLPERNPHWNDFDSARPCTLRGLKETKGLALVA